MLELRPRTWCSVAIDKLGLISLAEFCERSDRVSISKDVEHGDQGNTNRSPHSLTPSFNLKGIGMPAEGFWI